MASDVEQRFETTPQVGLGSCDVAVIREKRGSIVERQIANCSERFFNERQPIAYDAFADMLRHHGFVLKISAMRSRSSGARSPARRNTYSSYSSASWASWLYRRSPRMTSAATNGSALASSTRSTR